MENPSLEEAEWLRGQQAIATVLEQLAQAVGVVSDKADMEKAAADSARSAAEVQQ